MRVGVKFNMFGLPCLVVSFALVRCIGAAEQSPSFHQMIDIAKDAELAGAKFKEAAAPYTKDKLEQRIAQADLAAESAMHTALWKEMSQPNIGPCGECSKDYHVPCPKV